MTVCPEPGCVRPSGHALHADAAGELWVIGHPSDLYPSDPEEIP